MSIVTEGPGPRNGLVAGVDTHAEVHVAAVIDQVGRELGHASFPTSTKGYRELLAWIASHGVVERVGIEGTGSYGAGLCRCLTGAGVTVVEVDRPDRKARRFEGKSDPIDAYAAARATLSGRACGTPKSRDGDVEMIRVLRVARSSAIKARSAALNQLKAVVGTAPDGLRADLRPLNGPALVQRCAGLRPNRTAAATSARATAEPGPGPGHLTDTTAATKRTLSALAHRINSLTAEISDLDDDLDHLVTRTAPTLAAMFGVGTDVAGQLLVTAGDNPDRLHSPAAFVHLCGAAPIPASSGNTNKHRLNRGGDRQANAALYRVALSRLHYDDRTKAYRDHLAANQKTTKDIIRCLKHSIAREAYQAIKTDLLTEPGPH